MKVDFVADVGNSRVKWGFCHGESVAIAAYLPLNAPRIWQRQLELWNLPGPRVWAVAGVNPQRRDELAAWVRERGDRVALLDTPAQLPIRVRLPQPQRVGIDRLLNAVAAKDRIKRSIPLVIIDAGTAVTVDRVSAAGVFEGGAILPGLHLMAQALHDYTALLPLVAVADVPNVPGTATETAMKAGVFWAVAGGIKALVRLLSAGKGASRHRKVLLTGGDAELLAAVMDPDVTVWPYMTLEGIRLSAEALP
jgi:type III pantothenate kinase